MDAKRKGSERPGQHSASGGYSMVELLIAVGMAAVIGMGLYAVFNAQQRSSRSQKSYNDLQTTCNFAMEQMKNELRISRK